MSVLQYHDCHHYCLVLFILSILLIIMPVYHMCCCVCVYTSVYLLSNTYQPVYIRYHHYYRRYFCTISCLHFSICAYIIAYTSHIEKVFCSFPNQGLSYQDLLGSNMECLARNCKHNC